MNSNFVVEVPSEHINYLQRLGNDVDSKIFLIDKIFSNHINDKDISLFSSIPFKYYMKEYEKTYTEWELAKKEFADTFLKAEVEKLTNKKNSQFNWEIPDFLTQKCYIELTDED